MLQGKKILIGISGSIAAYKIPLLVRLLVKSGAEVRIVMTPASKDFVSELTLATLSRNPVFSELFDKASWNNHVELGRWADLMIIAPLSCNTLSKMAHAQCDSLLLAVYLSAVCPVVVAPAMDEDMWKHPGTGENLNLLRRHGVRVLPVGFGELASGLTGEGRMAEPEELLKFLQDFFAKGKQLAGKKVLLTAGPTYERIDPVRFIGNHSTGKMGFALAEELAARGASVTLVSGPSSMVVQSASIRRVDVTTAEEMFDACESLKDYDLAIMAAAVADYRPIKVADQKIKKNGQPLNLELESTKDILSSLGKVKKQNQKLIGFALETENERQNAIKKLKEKNADLIIMNSLNDEGAGFGHDTNKTSLFFSDGEERSLSLKSKKEMAVEIVDSIIEKLS